MNYLKDESSMVAKKELLAEISELIDFEDRVVVFEYVQFLEKVKDEELKQMLEILINDTRNHVLELSKIIFEIEEGKLYD